MDVQNGLPVCDSVRSLTWDQVLSQTVTSHHLTNHSGPVCIILIIIIVLDSFYIPSIYYILQSICCSRDSFLSLLDQSSRVVCLTASHSSDKSLFVQRGLCWPDFGLVWLWIFHQPLHCNQFFSLTSCDRYSITQTHTHTHRHMRTASLLTNTQLVSQPGWVLTLIDSTELAYWWCLAPCNSGSTWPRYRPGQLVLHPVAGKATWIEEEHHACLVSLILIWSSTMEPHQNHSLLLHSHFY